MKNSYLSLGMQTLISGVIMYLVMFVMIDGLDSFYNNSNMFYMTLMMVSPMVVLMILAMRHMFQSKAANIALIAHPLLPSWVATPSSVHRRLSATRHFCVR